MILTYERFTKTKGGVDYNEKTNFFRRKSKDVKVECIQKKRFEKKLYKGRIKGYQRSKTGFRANQNTILSG